LTQGEFIVTQGKTKVDRSFDIDKERGFGHALYLRIFNKTALPPEVVPDIFNNDEEMKKLSLQVKQEYADFYAKYHDDLMQKNPEYATLFNKYSAAEQKLKTLENSTPNVAVRFVQRLAPATRSVTAFEKLYSMVNERIEQGPKL
jgi:hypothetical protein